MGPIKQNSVDEVPQGATMPYNEQEAAVVDPSPAPASEKAQGSEKKGGSERQGSEKQGSEKTGSEKHVPHYSSEAEVLNLLGIARGVLKSVLLLSSIPFFLYFPFWLSTRFMRLDLVYTAKEFVDNCAAGDFSLEDPAHPFFAVGTLISFTFGFIPTYWVFPHEGIPPADALQDINVYREGCAKISKLKSRQIFGALFAVCFTIPLILTFLARFKIAFTLEQDHMLYLARSGTYAIGFVFASAGFVTQARQMNAEWVDSQVKRIFAGPLIFVYFLICQMFVMMAGRILNSFGNMGLVALMLLQNGIVAGLKQLSMRAGGDPGMLSMFSMGVGAAVGITLRQYVFVKPTIGDSIVATLISSFVTTSGHVFNYLVFTRLKVHKNAAFTHGTILFSDQVFELSVRLLCLTVLLAADTRYYAIADFGYGESPNMGLVLFNFAFSVFAQGVVAVIGINLMHRSTKFNIEMWAGSFKAWHAAVASGCTFAATINFALGLRTACLMCLPPDHRDAYTCFD